MEVLLTYYSESIIKASTQFAEFPNIREKAMAEDAIITHFQLIFPKSTSYRINDNGKIAVIIVMESVPKFHEDRIII